MMNYSIIGLKNFSIECALGARPEERKNLQTLYFDLEVKFEEKGLTKDLRKYISHEDLVTFCKSVVQSSEFLVLETLVEKILDQLFCDDRIMHAKICVKKPQGLKDVEYCFLQKERAR